MKTLPEICRCCLAGGCTKNITTEFINDSGLPETYGDIIKYTLNIEIQPLKLESKDAKVNLICDECIQILNTARAFKQRILNNQLRFRDHWNGLVNTFNSSVNDAPTELYKEELCRLQADVKTELTAGTEGLQYDYHYEDVQVMDADEDGDNDFLSDIKLELMKQESAVRPRTHPAAYTRRSDDCDDKDVNIAPDSITPDNTLMLIEHSNACLFHYISTKFTCYVCKKPFANIAELKRHTVTAHDVTDTVIEVLHDKLARPINCDTSNLKCKMCRDECANLTELMVHLTAHGLRFDRDGHNLLEFKLEYGYKCVVCRDGFEAFGKLHEHCMRHVRARAMCDVCGKVFECMARLRSHVDCCHAQRRVMSRVSALRENTATLLRHSNIWIFRHDSTTYRCFCCNLKIFDINTLKEHSTQHTVKETEERMKTVMYKCPNIKAEISGLECNKCKHKFDDLQKFKAHLTEEHGVCFFKSGDHYLVPYYLEGGLKCGFCKEEFKVMQTLTRHVNRHLTKVVCDVCGSRFSNERALKHHKRRNHKEIKCDLCDLKFDSFAQRKEHNKTHKNRPKKRSKCLFCDKQFTYSENRYRHMKSQHNYRPPEYKCDVCNRIFYTRTALTTHTASHAKMKSKPHKCDMCDLIFYKKLKLDEHSQERHAELMKYKCAVCENKFVSLNLLKRHLVNYCEKFGKNRCSYCGKDMRNKVGLFRHYSKIHNLIDSSETK